MANQVDLTPSTGAPFLHVHVPSGQTASVVNNSSDFPHNPATLATTTKAVSVTVTGTQGSVVRFSSPA